MTHPHFQRRKSARYGYIARYTPSHIATSVEAVELSSIRHGYYSTIIPTMGCLGVRIPNVSSAVSLSPSLYSLSLSFPGSEKTYVMSQVVPLFRHGFCSFLSSFFLSFLCHADDDRRVPS